jgi:hypothetical protein
VGGIASRNPRSSPRAQYSTPYIAEAGGRWQSRSPGILQALSLVSHGAECAKDPPAGERYPLASRRFSSLLALKITTTRRPAKDPRGHSPPRSRDERYQPLWGAPRIHGELLKLGINVGLTTVAKYMARVESRRGGRGREASCPAPPAQVPRASFTHQMWRATFST